MPETSQPNCHAMTCDHAPTQPVHLRAGGVSLVLDSPNAHLPRILYWGEELTGITDTSLAALATMTTPPPPEAPLTPQRSHRSSPNPLPDGRAPWA